MRTYAEMYAKRSSSESRTPPIWVVRIFSSMNTLMQGNIKDEMRRRITKAQKLSMVEELTQPTSSRIHRATTIESLCIDEGGRSSVNETMIGVYSRLILISHAMAAKFSTPEFISILLETMYVDATSHSVLGDITAK